AGGELRQPGALVLFAAERDHGRAAHTFADPERLAQPDIVALLLLPDHALDWGGAAAAIFLLPLQAGPAAFGFLLLPGLGCGDDAVPARRGARAALRQLRHKFGRGVGTDPAPRFLPKRGFLRGVVEVHRCRALVVGAYYSARRGRRQAAKSLRSLGLVPERV